MHLPATLVPELGGSMSFKVNHYAAKTISPKPQLDIESIAIELSIGIILGVMAIGGYNAGVLLMAVPCGLISLACFLLAVVSISRFVIDRRIARQQQQNLDPEVAESD